MYIVKKYQKPCKSYNHRLSTVMQNCLKGNPAKKCSTRETTSTTYLKHALNMLKDVESHPISSAPWALGRIEELTESNDSKE